MTTENNQGGATPPGDKTPPQDKQEKKPTENSTPPPADLTKLAEELKTAQERIAELNKENQKHRLSRKEVEDLAARQKKALELLTGKSDETPDPAELQKKATDEKVRRAYLKAAFVAEAAKNMHDADFAFDAMSRELSDVQVNLDTGEVDKTAIRTKLEDVKKARPFLFVSNNSSGNNTPRPPPGNPDGNGQPAGGNPYQQWLTMKADPLRAGEAQEFYSKNRAAILAHMK